MFGCEEDRNSCEEKMRKADENEKDQWTDKEFFIIRHRSYDPAERNLQIRWSDPVFLSYQEVDLKPLPVMQGTMLMEKEMTEVLWLSV